MRASRIAASIVIVSVAACGTSGGSNDFGFGDGGTSSGNASGGGNNSGSFGGDASMCALGSTSQGCPCGTAGDTSACWTGPADQRNVGACHDGTAQCQQMGEFANWGPCMGEQLDCGSSAADGGGTGVGGGGHEDAGGKGVGGGGTEDGGGKGVGGGGAEDGGGCPQTACACVPGAVIDCDEDCTGGVYCSSSAQKTCQPDGTWGACHEVTTMQPTTCKSIGVGCSTSYSCNYGQGVYYGDCSAAFTCDVGSMASGGGSAVCNNNVCTVNCNCGNGGSTGL